MSRREGVSRAQRMHRIRAGSGLKRLQSDGSIAEAGLTERQATVLRALVSSYVEHAGPVASGALSKRMPTSLSPASIRNTLAELHQAGLIEKAHASAGRVPTRRGLRVFIDHLLDLSDLGPDQQRILDRAFDGVDAAQTPRHASHLLSEHTRQLGFMMAPRVEHLRMRSVHLVSVAERRILAVLIAENGGIIQRVFDYPERLSARELDRAAVLLAKRLAGRTLKGLRRLLEGERERLRGEADQWMRRVWALGLRACEGGREGEDDDDLVIATRITLLEQPEFSDPERIRGLFAALETNHKLLGLLRELARADTGDARVGLSISLGNVLGEPSIRDCALVAVPYGHLPAGDRRRFSTDLDVDVDLGSAKTVGRIAEARRVQPRSRFDEEHRPPEPGQRLGEAEFEDSSLDGSLGVLGVIGPQRMDYGRVIPLVSYCAELVTRKMLA